MIEYWRSFQYIVHSLFGPTGSTDRPSFLYCFATCNNSFIFSCAGCRVALPFGCLFLDDKNGSRHLSAACFVFTRIEVVQFVVPLLQPLPEAFLFLSVDGLPMPRGYGDHPSGWV